MNISRRNIVVLLMTIVLIFLVQLIRLDLVLSLNSTNNVIQYEYHQDQAESLTVEGKGNCTKPSSLIIYNQDNLQTLENIEAVLQTMQFQQDKMTASDHRDNYQDYDLILVLEQTDDQLLDSDKIINAVRNGSHLLYLGNGALGQQDFLKANASVLGLNSWEEIGVVTTFNFNTEILSGITGELTLDGNNSALANRFHSLRVNLTDDCLVHVSGDQDNPVIWEQKLDNGNTMVVNTGYYNNKRIRGLLTGAISVFLDTVIYPVTQSSVWQIVNIPVDDHFEAEILNDHYSRNFNQYILNIWWPDMVALMKKYNLKYTVSYLGSFETDGQGPFIASSLSGTDFNTLSEAVIKGNGEISFQGYNNLPLLTARSDRSSETNIFWPDQAKMIEALQCGTDFLKQLLPNYQIHTYVPPNNQLDEDAIEILKQRLPDLKTISGTYFNQESGQDSQDSDRFIQDFALDERYGVAFPQVSAGCFLSDDLRFDMASVVTTQGIISHVIKADEILDSVQSRGLLWEGLYDQYDNLLRQTDHTYSWLSHDTVTEAAEKLKQAVGIDLYYTRNDQTISIACDHFDQDATLILVTTKAIKSSQGCDFKRIDSIRYLVTMHEKRVTLEVGSE